MNYKLEGFARKYLKVGLAKCTGQEQHNFKYMYGGLSDDINELVDKMGKDKLSYAMDQVDRTLDVRKDKVEVRLAIA